MSIYEPPICTCGGATGAVEAANHWHAEFMASQSTNERLRTEILAVINSFDNRDFSATPDQRDVIDLIRRVLGRHRAS